MSTHFRMKIKLCTKPRFDNETYLRNSEIVYF